jgi:hypothetical protein
MLMLLAVLEIFARFPRFKNANANAGLILAMAAPITVITALCGWLLSLGGGYAANLLEWHERFGIATAAGCVLAAILYHFRKITAYRVVLFFTVAALTVAGHLGGSLTHGRDYLTRYLPAPLKRVLGISAAGNGKPAPAPTAGNALAGTNALAVFQRIIAPVLENKCVSCHGPDKSKGGLRLDSYAGIQAGGDDGLILDTNHPDRSEMWRRINLPVDDDDHMPPDGKPQLTADETAVLKWWVESGAPATNVLATRQLPKAVQTLLAPRVQGN